MSTRFADRSLPELVAIINHDFSGPRMPTWGMPLESTEVDVHYVPHRLGFVVCARTRYGATRFDNARGVDSAPLFEDPPTYDQVYMAVRNLLQDVAWLLTLQVHEDHDFQPRGED